MYAYNRGLTTDKIWGMSVSALKRFVDLKVGREVARRHGMGECQRRFNISRTTAEDIISALKRSAMAPTLIAALRGMLFLSGIQGLSLRT
jgi:hypothetical protein